MAASYLMEQHNVLARVAQTAKDSIKAPLSGSIGILIVSAFFAVLTVIAMGWTSRIRWRLLTTAGLLTYPFYLLHENIGWLVIHATRDWAPHPVVLVGAIAFMLLVAGLVHRFVERPLAAHLRKRLSPPPRRVEPPEQPVPATPGVLAQPFAGVRVRVENRSEGHS